MPALYGHHWSIFKAWKDWKAVCLSFADSDVCSEYELKRRADYLGIPVAQLRWVSSFRPDPISLLERRMEALSLNPDEVAYIEPLTVRELQQRCVKCKKPGQCALEQTNSPIPGGSPGGISKVCKYSNRRGLIGGRTRNLCQSTLHAVVQRDE
jgi:hypothetical protein